MCMYKWVPNHSIIRECSIAKLDNLLNWLWVAALGFKFLNTFDIKLPMSETQRSIWYKLLGSTIENKPFMQTAMLSSLSTFVQEILYSSHRVWLLLQRAIQRWQNYVPMTQGHEESEVILLPHLLVAEQLWCNWISYLHVEDYQMIQDHWTQLFAEIEALVLSKSLLICLLCLMRNQTHSWLSKLWQGFLCTHLRSIVVLCQPCSH